MNFFRIRMERVTLAERKFLNAMTKVVDGEGRCRVSDITEKLGVSLNGIGPRRSSLIRKGMIYSPAHGQLAFTVPLFADYMMRNAPAR